jgi:integrase
MGIKDLGNGKYRIDLRIGGRRGSRHRATISATRDEARQAYADLRKATQQAGGTGATLRDAYVHATVHRYHERKDRAGVEDRWRVLTQLLDENMQLSTLDTRAITQLLTDLRTRTFKGRTLTAGTINKHLSLLRTILKEGSRARPALIEPDDLPYIPHLKESQAKRRPLKAEEEQRVIAWLCSQGDDAKWAEFRDFVLFSLEEGTRSGETRRLERVDVDLEAGGFGECRVRDPKNGEERYVPITERARPVVLRRLAVALKQRDRLFAGLTKAILQDRWQEVQDALNLHDVVIHSFRHTAGKRLIDQTQNVRVAQAWLGHKRVETTVRYTMVDREALHRAARQLSAAGSSAPTKSQPDEV